MGAVAHRGSIAAGISTMLLLGIFLSWIPGLGPLAAGLIGGRVASGVRAAMTAVLLPCIILGALLFLLTPLFVGLPYIGVIAETGAATLVLTQIGSLCLGAAIGGLLSH